MTITLTNERERDEWLQCLHEAVIFGRDEPYVQTVIQTADTFFEELQKRIDAGRSTPSGKPWMHQGNGPGEP